MALKNSIDTQIAEKRLAAWLSDHYPHAEKLRVHDLNIPASAGLSNETVLFAATWEQDGRTRTRELVARVQPEGEGVFPSYDLGKEARVISALHEASIAPVPGIVAYVEDASVLGSPFMVMERVVGQIPSDDPPFTAGGWVLDLTAEQRTRMWENSIDVLAKIHSTDWVGLGLGFLDTVENGSDLDAQLAYWNRFFEWATEGEPNPNIEYALKWLADNKPRAVSEKVLNWGDARVGNIIYDEGLMPAAVLDWEMVTLGAPEADLGWWFFLERHHTEGIGMPVPEGNPTREQTIARYEAASGRKLADLHYYEVFAGTRLAIIMVRAAHMMIGAGMLPPDAPMALSNPASQLMSKLLELPAPAGATTTFIGNR